VPRRAGEGFGCGLARGEAARAVEVDRASEPSDTKEHYKFPYGDFDMVHRCGLLAAESRAGQHKCAAIEAAAARLLGLLDKLAPAPPNAADRVRKLTAILTA